MKDARIFLVDILERARRVERYAADGREALQNSDLLQDAVLRNLEIIGEAAKQVPSEYRERCPSKMAGFPWIRRQPLG
ncbi:MAG: HepT-like ribonuclease domain-containing protein [Gemmatimonadota bacterium]